LEVLRFFRKKLFGTVWFFTIWFVIKNTFCLKLHFLFRSRAIEKLDHH